MARIEKSVFISYRRTNTPWALAIYQYLTAHGYDCFFDFASIDSGDFEQIIIGNIKARAHFIVILTPSALERCDEPNDWLRREIECALDCQRNMVPLMLEGFDYGSPSIKKYLTGKLATLSKYNAQRIPADFFDEAMGRVCNRFLNVALDAVLHPATEQAQQAAVKQKQTVAKEERVTEKQLTAGEWLEQGLEHYNQKDYDRAIADYNEAIRLKPDDAKAYRNRGNARREQGDYDSAIADYEVSLRIGKRINSSPTQQLMAKVDKAIAETQSQIGEGKPGNGSRDAVGIK